MKLDLSLPCDTSSFSLLSLEYIGQLVCRSSSVVVKSHVLTSDCYYHSAQQSFEIHVLRIFENEMSFRKVIS